jgi:ferric-dicitrate binding protein FerR (iron transport regulator)
MASPRNRSCPKAAKPSLCGAAIVLAFCISAAGSAVAQSGVCVLSPDKHNPNERVLRCGSDITIFPAPGTQYHVAPAAEGRVPASIELDSGALLIEFHSKRRHDFQILTPATVASVRGTKWATEVKPGQTSTLVLEGQVTVRRKNSSETVVVGPGEGVDVFTGMAGTGKRKGRAAEPIAVKRWAPARVKALLARFGG